MPQLRPVSVLARPIACERTYARFPDRRIDGDPLRIPDGRIITYDVIGAGTGYRQGTTGGAGVAIRIVTGPLFSSTIL